MQIQSPEAIWSHYPAKVNLEHSGAVLKEYLRILALFKDFLGNERPTIEKAREYLQQFIHRSRNTRARYTDIINGILEYCNTPNNKAIRVVAHFSSSGIILLKPG
jgi:hypothetical protein